MDLQLSLSFDYSGIEPTLADEMRAVEKRISGRNQKVARIMVQNGTDLLSIRGRLERGKFLAWIEDCCGLSKSAAYRLMDVAERLADELPTVGSLPPTAIYQLAAPTTPDPVRKEIVTRLKAGEEIAPEQIIETLKAAREADRAAKADAKLSPEERKRREQKERRQRKTREQHEAEMRQQQKEREERRAQQEEAARKAVAMIEERLGPDLPDLIRLILKADYAFATALKGVAKQQSA